jgi:hypothetical protein
MQFVSLGWVGGVELRVTPGDLPSGSLFGGDFGLCGSVYGQGWKYFYFRAGKHSLARGDGWYAAFWVTPR